MEKEFQKHPSETDKDVRSDLQHRLRSAVDGAHEYTKSPDGTGQAGDDPVKPMEEWRDIVSQRIEDAMRQGLFDGLAGEGKPLNLDRDPFLPEDQQMAVTLLRNNGLAPEWISERTAILAAIENVRIELRHAAAHMRSAMEAAPPAAPLNHLLTRWMKQVDDWQARMVKLNDRILIYNLKQPISHLEIFQLRLSDELARAGVDQEWMDSRLE